MSARFFGWLHYRKGRPPITRLGYDAMSAGVQGWELGGKVVIIVDDYGRDRVIFKLTKGSNAPSNDEGVEVFSHSERQNLDLEVVENNGEIELVVSRRNMTNFETEL